MNNQKEINDFVIKYNKLSSEESRLTKIAIAVISIVMVSSMVYIGKNSPETLADVSMTTAIDLLTIIVKIILIMIIPTVVWKIKANKYITKRDNVCEDAKLIINNIINDIEDVTADVTWRTYDDKLSLYVTLGEKYDAITIDEFKNIESQINDSLGSSASCFKVTYFGSDGGVISVKFIPTEMEETLSKQ